MKKTLIVSGLLLLGIALGSAQTATPHVTKRQLKQQARIEQGAKSGELTAGETKRLELQQAKIQADKRKAKSDGTVTPAERAKLAREQNRANRKIYRLKHNDKSGKVIPRHACAAALPSPGEAAEIILPIADDIPLEIEVHNRTPVPEAALV